ncbi:MAG: GGDEF domain-containing protein, partial [Pseudomonadales bacterium]|nr:GGDEF domain-containing protein [Pseudomonadales bacterium]
IAGFDCTISQDDYEPICRLGVWINNSKTKGLDLSNYNTIKVYGNFISPSTQDFLRISLRNYESEVPLHDIETHYKYNLVEIQTSELTQPIEVDFNRFIVPNWWLAKVSDQNIKSEVDLTNISLIEISTAHLNTPGEYKFRISAIELHKQIFSIEKLYEYLLISWAILFLTIFILITIYLGYKIKQKFHNEHILLEINRSLSKRSEKLEIAHKTDELTSVLNRNGMKDKMLECLSNNWFPMSAVMIDIDFFKKINDTLGHQKGDEVLINLGKILNGFTQNNESISRYGGEEFILLLPNTTQKTIELRLEQLREKIQNTDLGVGYSVTASFGVATSIHKTEFNSLVEKADKALYEAKHNGRNCIKYAN